MAIDVDELVRLAGILEAAEQAAADALKQRTTLEAQLEQVKRLESQIAARITKARDAVIQRITGSVK